MHMEDVAGIADAVKDMKLIADHHHAVGVAVVAWKEFAVVRVLPDSDGQR
jgi:hypothetical protein